MSDPAWRHLVERLVAAGRWIAERDELPQVEPVAHPERRIAQRHELPKLEPIPGPGRSLKDASTWLTAPDRLPLKPRPVREQRHLLLSLVSSEPLPNAGPPHGSDTGSFSLWLLKTEKLPPLPADSKTLEASSDEP